MSLSIDEVKNIAGLARLTINDDNIPEYASNLSKILDFVAQLNTVDTQDVIPMSHPLDINLRLRKDESVVVNDHESIIKLAPQSEAGLYIVPQVID